MNDDPFAELSPIIKAAEYPGGTPVLVAYLKHESSALIENSSGNPLESGRVYFMVDASGNVSDAMIDSSCGYPKIDEKMLELINALPERFDPAQDGNGTTMVQELCFYYGMIGC